MLDFIPDTQRLSQIFSSATSPTFFLGAVAAFAALMTSRMSDVMRRARELTAISEEDLERAFLKDDLDRLLMRANLLKSGIFSALIAGVCATMLLAVLFVSEFLGLHYAYGAGALFIVSTLCLGWSLYKFAKEVSISLHEADKY